MSFYENTLVTKQDLPESQLKIIKEKYSDLINSNSGKVIKIEEWGLLNLSRKIKRYNKAFYIHYKFEGSKKTLNEINKKIKIDDTILRHLIVKYKILDIKNEYFKREKN
jgi:small subunit ribosomal protein S6